MATKRRGTAADLGEEHVARLVEKWRARLLASEWSLGVRVLPDCDTDEDNKDAFAYTMVDAPYFVAKITFNAKRFSGKDEAFLDLVACHEVLHVVLHESEHLVARALKDQHMADVVCENAVERLSRALVRLQRGGR